MQCVGTTYGQPDIGQMRGDLAEICTGTDALSRAERTQYVSMASAGVGAESQRWAVVRPNVGSQL